jgi:hypothetical protein
VILGFSMTNERDQERVCDSSGGKVELSFHDIQERVEIKRIGERSLEEM